MKNGLKIVLISGLTLMLSACFTSEEERIKDHRVKCEMYGFLPGTDQFARCVQGRESRHEDNQLDEEKSAAEPRGKSRLRKGKMERHEEKRRHSLPRYPHHHNLDKQATSHKESAPARAAEKVHEKAKTEVKQIQGEANKGSTDAVKQHEEQVKQKVEQHKKRITDDVDRRIDNEQKHREERKRRRNSAPSTSPAAPVGTPVVPAEVPAKAS